MALPKRTIWAKIHRVWIVFGITASLIFFGWCFFAYQASDAAKAALISTLSVRIQKFPTYMSFHSADKTNSQLGFVFFAGSVVDPVAYAPILAQTAGWGYPSLLIYLPRRGFFGAANDDAVLNRAQNAMKKFPTVKQWVIGGHSKGGAVAARFALIYPKDTQKLILIGTSHPRDFSLADSHVPVTKLVGTKDGLASPSRCKANRRNLPNDTEWITIQGANHSQFGYYGFQPGDRFAEISREEQQKQTMAAIRRSLEMPAPLTVLTN